MKNILNVALILGVMVLFVGCDDTSGPTNTGIIYGSIGVEGVNVSIEGRTVRTDTNGRYIFEGLTPGTYTVRPSRQGTTFEPPTRTVKVEKRTTVEASFKVQDNVTPGIEGTITENGRGLSGVRVTAGAYSATTDQAGQYVLNGIAPGSYEVIPTLSGYTFAPPSRSVSLSSGTRLTNINFTATKSSGGGNSNQIMPLADGNSWTYRVIYYDKGGTPYGDTIATSQLYSTTYLGEQCYIFYNDIHFDSYYRNRPDGLWTVAETPKEWRVIFKYPATLGERYPWPFDNDSRDDTRCTVESISRSITVPAGTFTCVLYNVYNESSFSGERYYIAPGVGLVRYERYQSTGLVSSRSELLSYKLN